MDESTAAVCARNSQRAPRSCKECSRRKIKCDKIVPCRPCVDRGEAILCRREIVRVKGRLLNTNAVLDVKPETPEQELARLRRENEILRRQITSSCSNVAAASVTDLVYSTGEARAVADQQLLESTDDVGKYAEALQYLVLGLVKEEDSDSESLTGNAYTSSASSASQHARRHSTKDPRLECAGTGSTSPRMSLSSDRRGSCGTPATFPVLSRTQSQKIVMFGLVNLRWIHCAIHTGTFWEEHEVYWDSISAGGRLHGFRDEGEVVAEDHFWKAVWYAVLCTGLYFMDREVAKAELGFTNEQHDAYPEQFFSASLGELDKAQFMRYPNIRSVQTVCILSLVSHTSFGDFHLHYCMLNSVIYIAQFLNLHRLGSEKTWLEREKSKGNRNTELAKGRSFLDREIGRRMWWALVIIDWLSGTGRLPIISSHNFDTALPGNYEDEDLYLSSESIQPRPADVTTVVSYHIVMAKLAIIQRKLFFENQAMRKPTLNQVQHAEREVDKLIHELPPSLDITRSGNISPSSNIIHDFQRHLLTMTISMTRLNMHMAVHDRKTRAEWNAISRQVCLNSAITVVLERRKPVPAMFQKNWLVSAHSVAAGIFLILDYLESSIFDYLDLHAPRANVGGNLAAVTELAASLRPLMQWHPLARRGASLLQRLLNLVSSNECDPARRKRSLDETSAEIDLPALLERIGLYPSVSNAATSPAGTPSVKPVMGEERCVEGMASGVGLGAGLGLGVGAGVASRFVLPTDHGMGTGGLVAPDEWNSLFSVHESWMLG